MKPRILDKIKNTYGYVVFEDGDYDLNIIGVRNLDNASNVFDDKLHVCYKVCGQWQHDIFTVTTDPGRYWLTKADYKDCAIYAHPQQARGAYKLGLHRNLYPSLVQARGVKFWRDGNKDEKADYKSIEEAQTAIIGLHIHRSSIYDSVTVDKYSAGCIVFSKMDEWNSFMDLVNKQKQIAGFHTFTFTLIAE